jgi:tetratricopeptide (TPR) repeat protein
MVVNGVFIIYATDFKRLVTLLPVSRCFMAKSNPTHSGNKKSPAPSTPVPPSVARPITNYLLRPESEATTPRQNLFFWLTAGIALITMLFFSTLSGVNADDKFQHDYSTKLVNYYSTFGQDTTALYIKDGNMHLYGGFFEIVTGFANKWLNLTPNDWSYHHVRHAANALMGWVALLCVGFLTRYIAGNWAGIIAMLLIWLSPRFFGDSMMNPKDIPFAAGYVMALYNMARVLDRLPRPNRWHLAGLVAGLAIALATRAGGLLPFAMLFMFAGLHFLLKNGGVRAFGQSTELGKYLLYVVVAAAVGYFLAVLFWPYALQNPLKNPLNALAQFADLEVKIRVLYEGNNVKSDVTPWHYPIKWIMYTIPLSVLAGWLGSIVLLPRLLRQYHPLWVLMALFAAVFPVFYIIYKDSVIHDGWRHLTFAYPTMVVSAALFWNELYRILSERKALQYATLGVLGLGTVDAAAFIGANSSMPYVYFNPLTGGTKGAFGQFETDYWGISVRQGIEWMEQQGILKEGMTEGVVIATNMFYPAQKLTAKYGAKVKIKYLRWEVRCDDAWDYALYPTRFIDGTTLRNGKWPPDNAVHIVEAGGAPILAVLKDNGKNCGLGIAASKVGDWPTAIERLKVEVSNVPDNDLAWTNLGQAYLNRGRQLAQTDPIAAAADFEAAKQAAEKCLEESGPNNLLGMYWVEKNNLGKAKSQFERAIKLDPSNLGAYYYLAMISYNNKDGKTALTYLQKCIEISPMYKPAYQLAADIYEQSGNASQAAQMRNILQQLK